MANEELLAKITTEIERLYHKIDDRNPLAPNQKAGYLFALADVLSFLSTLEEQAKYKVRNPIFDECVSRVDPKVREEVRRNIDFEQELYNRFGQVKDFTLGMRIGQYFYELGCRRTAEKYDEIEYNRQRAEEQNGEELEKEIYDYCPDSFEGFSFDNAVDLARHFAKWGAEHAKNEEEL